MDFNNRQLAEIISQTAEKINSNVLKERKIANEIEETSTKIEKHLEEFSSQISKLQTTSIKPDLNDLNAFYEEKTAENIKQLNSRLNVPNLAIYLWLSSLALFVLSAFMIWFFVKSKQDILTQYEQGLAKEGKVITTKEREDLLNDMIGFFDKNPNTKQLFIKGRNK